MEGLPKVAFYENINLLENKVFKGGKEIRYVVVPINLIDAREKDLLLFCF